MTDKYLGSATMAPPVVMSGNLSVSGSEPTSAGVTSHYVEQDLAWFLYAGPSVILLLLGTVGNVLSFIVFNRSTMRQSVTSIYFRVLAVSDTVVLLSASPVFFLIGAFSIDIRTFDTFSCKFWLPLLVVSCYHSCWILVFIACDRFIGVYAPHKYRRYCSQRRAVVGMVLLFVLVSSTVGTFWVLALGLDPESGACGIQPAYMPFFLEVFRWMDLCLLNLFPTVILVSLNIGIILKVSRATLLRQTSIAGSGGGEKGTKRKVSSPTAILLSVSLVYILCTIPSSTAFLVKPAFGSDAHGQAQVLLYVRCCETLYLANHAVNFFLYCVHGTGFRKELRGLCGRLSDRSTSRTDSTGLSPIRTKSSKDSTLDAH